MGESDRHPPLLWLSKREDIPPDSLSFGVGGGGREAHVRCLLLLLLLLLTRCHRCRPHPYIQVLEVACADSKATYDEVKSRRDHPAVADVAGAPVSRHPSGGKRGGGESFVIVRGGRGRRDVARFLFVAWWGCCSVLFVPGMPFVCGRTGVALWHSRPDTASAPVLALDA